jgi:hypothetical protein
MGSPWFGESQAGVRTLPTYVVVLFSAFRSAPVTRAQQKR